MTSEVNPISILNFLYQNKNEYMSLLFIHYYQMQNVTEVAEALDRSKSNAHAYITNLKSQDLISQVPKNEIIEPRYTDKPGPKKIYQLSPTGSMVFETYLTQFFGPQAIQILQQQVELNPDDYIQQLIQSLLQPPNQSNAAQIDPIMRSYFFSVTNEVLEKIAFREYMNRMYTMQEELARHLGKLIDPKQRDEATTRIQEIVETNPALILNELLEIPIHSFEDTKELTQIIVNFFQQLFDFKNNRNHKSNPRGSQYLYFFSGFLENGQLFSTPDS